ncbi:MAG TPA: hypothetical protein DCL44_07305 [Elusimicrobia bacterium]|nr:hypothetical protein [Elusimicrobiota bacterium]
MRIKNSCRKNFYILFFLFAAAFMFSIGRARAESGLTGAAILNRPIGTRSSGMGRAFAAVPGDAESVMYNPAGLGFVSGTGAYMSYMNGFGGGRYGFAAAPIKLKNFVLTPALLYYDSGKMNLDLSDGTSGSVTAELDKVGMISAAFKPLKNLAIGGTLKFTGINLAETASVSLRHYDFGLLYSMSKGFSFGAAVLNNGDAVKFVETSDPAPKTTRVGIAYKVELKPPNLMDSSADVSYSELVLTSDWSRVVNEKGYYQSGLELNMKMPYSMFLSFRVGYLMDRSEEGLTFGLSIRKDKWNFGFGCETSKDLDSRLPVSVSYEF